MRLPELDEPPRRRHRPENARQAVVDVTHVRRQRLDRPLVVDLRQDEPVRRRPQGRPDDPPLLLDDREIWIAAVEPRSAPETGGEPEQQVVLCLPLEEERFGVLEESRHVETSDRHRPTGGTPGGPG